MSEVWGRPRGQRNTPHATNLFAGAALPHAPTCSKHAAQAHARTHPTPCWRDARPPLGTRYEPRVKVVKEGSPPTDVSYDIANLHYSKLPPAWQKDNLEAAKSASYAVERHAFAFGYDFDEQFYAKACAECHRQWIERNKSETGGWLQVGDPQRVPFEELSTEDQKKTRRIIEAAIEIALRGNNS